MRLVHIGNSSIVNLSQVLGISRKGETQIIFRYPTGISIEWELDTYEKRDQVFNRLKNLSEDVNNKYLGSGVVLD